MKRISIFVLALFCGMGLFAQREGFQYHFSGFVDPQLFFDTRQVVGAREGELLFYPAPKDLDAEGNDLNAVPNLNMLAITTRLGMKVDAPEIGKWKTGAYVEGDFTGSNESGINMLRLRHAYLSFRRDRSTVLLGQFWHPMVVHELMPGTRPLNMGMPFHPYSRYVQARYSYRTCEYYPFLRVDATAAFQLDNSSSGPSGKSTEYLRNTALPEGNVQLWYGWNGDYTFNTVGCMMNAEVLQPRRFVTDMEGLQHKSETVFPSFAFSLFGWHIYRFWRLCYQGIVGDNLFEQGMLGGYLETLSSSGLGYDYEPFGCAAVWADFRRIEGKWRPGLFAGYTRNLFFGHSFDGDAAVYGRGFDIDNVWRVQPQVSYHPFDHLFFCAEIEFTSATYGEKLSNGFTSEYHAGYAVSNTRFIFSAVCCF